MDTQTAPTTVATDLVSAEHLPEDIVRELAYLARHARLVHPRGRFDGAQRWYPDEEVEGGTPAVRSPSRGWPYSYMLGCRTRRWCRESLPIRTARADAGAALRALAAGTLEISDRLARQIAQQLPA